MSAIDLYRGIGGWTLGLQMADIPVTQSYEWWKEANNTYNKNFGASHAEVNIRDLLLEELSSKEKVEVIVGSPPCTQFSLSNRGGKGNIEDGLIDIYKFLEVVEYLEPKYWAMENVPRVAAILEKEIAANGKLNRFKYLLGDIKVYTSSDFGVPQDRKRMIAGSFPFYLLDGYSKKIQKITLGEVIAALDQDVILDPVYGISLDKLSLTDHVLEPNLSREEERINYAAKTHHPVYNTMSFPDRLDRPARTLTSLCTRTSRESVIIRDYHNNIRRLSIRERACVQSFPINFQFFGSYQDKIKMIGNAIPPALAFYIIQSMKETPVEDVLSPASAAFKLTLSHELATSGLPMCNKPVYAWNRSFCFAIPGLRFGSGMRFEVKNYPNKETKSTAWRINFFFGNSKKIKCKDLNAQLLIKALVATGIESDKGFDALLKKMEAAIENIDRETLQVKWANKDISGNGPIDLVDALALHSTILKDYIEKHLPFPYAEKIKMFIAKEFSEEAEKALYRKIKNNSIAIYVGILIGSVFNADQN